MKEALRVGLATVAASVAPVLAAGSIELIFDSYASLSSIRIIFLSALVIALGHMLILGLPVAFWLRRIAAFRFSNVVISGIVIGVLPTLLLQLVPWLFRVGQRSADPVLPGLVAVIAAGIFGCIGAIAFFLVCHREWLSATYPREGSAA